MSDAEELSQEELLQQKHRKEKKELQAKVQKLKHSVSKGDKKKKKEVSEQIAALENELAARQSQEIADLQCNGVPDSSQVAERLEALSTNDVENDSTSSNRKPSKAQKRREKKAIRERNRDEEIREQEIKNLTGSRHLEFNQIKALLKEKGLQISEIPSDGNCLYNAIAHQLNGQGNKTNNEDLRKRCAQYLRDHEEDFMPFLDKDNGDPYTSEEFEKYCENVATTRAWGGHLEIKALSHVLHQPITIVQGEGLPITMGEEFQNPEHSPIILCYHRYAFGLGEHYNSVENFKDEKSEFE